MGPVFVLGLWMTIAMISVILGMLAFGLTALLTRGVGPRRIRALWFAGLLPAVVFGYAIICVLMFSTWRIHTGRQWDWGQSDKSNITIAGSYHLQQMSASADEAKIYSSNNGNASQIGNVISRVQLLDVRPPLLLGKAFPEGPYQTPVYFILDTETNKRTDEPSVSNLEAAAIALGKPLQLEPVEVVYRRYFSEYSKLDIVVLVSFALPPLIALVALAVGLRRLRSGQQLA